jgi:Protein of unknown function (DUF2934)
MPLPEGNNLDKEMEKKRSPTRNRGQKEKPATERNANAALDPESSAGIPGENGHSVDAADFTARVARKAYGLFERRGGQTGSDVEDWLTAEQLVKEEIVRRHL